MGLLLSVARPSGNRARGQGRTRRLRAALRFGSALRFGRALLLPCALGVSVFFAAGAEETARAAGSSAKGAGVVVDRAVVRFSAPEGGGRERPYFIYQRELAFEARLVALADSSHRGKEPYRRHHIQQALERHVAESLLSALSIDPVPNDEEIAQQLNAARKMVIDEVGGEGRLLSAADAEGLGSLEVRRYFRRRALASLYLHTMVTPMLTPSALELRRMHRAGEGPLSDRSFEEAEPALRRWYIARSLRLAVANYYQNARARVRLEFLD